MEQLKFKVLVLFLIAFQVIISQNKGFDNMRKSFVEGYTTLQIPYLQIDYIQNLQTIKDVNQVNKQERFFQEFKNKLTIVDLNTLSEYQKLDFYIMTYEIEINLERLLLEKYWDRTTVLDNAKGVFTIPNGKKWYTYLLKRWVNDKVTPDEIFQFGLEEIEKVKAEMKTLQEQSGLSEKAFAAHLNDTSFFFHNVKDVKKAYEKVKLEVAKKTSEIFPYIKAIPNVNITRGTNEALVHAPAYYNNGTFYFNYFDEPYNKRQLDWIYIHEGIPGHHYQIMVNNVIKRTQIQQLFWYSGFVEGWGAYVEYLGKDLGVYRTIYDEYGKWEWDLIRSVRVALDVGINYYGWTDDKAISFWKKYIANQDDIGLREIARMKRWPAQVVTYKYGANAILKLLEEAKKHPNFEYHAFHKKILMHGDIPITILVNHISVQ